MRRDANLTITVFALVAVYLVWGSTYLAIRFGLEGFPPLMLGGIRFLIAGLAMFVVLRWRGAAMPTRAQWWNTTRVAALMLVGAVGLVAIAEDIGVGSGVAAAAVAIIPVWAALASGLFGEWPRRLEWIGLAVGFAGVLVLVQEGDLQSSPLGLALVLIAPVLWAVGSVWGTRLDMPRPLTAAAAELLTAGVILMILSLLRGERIEATPTVGSVLALGYLIVFGSIIAYSAYVYLLENTRPAMATSYAYVNPAVAVVLGVSLGAEIVTGQVFLALPLILGGVAIVTLAQRRQPPHDVEPEGASPPSDELVDEAS
jgi:drug/metabolite transporter (DMT)-like permease